MRYPLVMLAYLSAALLANYAQADTISMWTGKGPALSGWSNPVNWNPQTVPNNSGGTAYDVVIPGNSLVGIDISPTIQSLSSDGTLYAVQGALPHLTVVNNATINSDLLFAAAFLQPPAGPGSLTVGGNLGLGAYSVVDGSVVVGGNLTSSQLAVFVSESGNNSLQVGGTMTNQAGGTVLLGYERCFGQVAASCPNVVLNLSPSSLASAPATTVGNLVNNGQMFSWAGIKSSSVSNSGTLSLISGTTSAATLTNSGTLYISNACCSIAPEQTAGISVGTGAPNAQGYAQSADGVLKEVLSGAASYGQIIAGPWPTPPRGALAGYSIDLNGTLDIALANGFTPAIGETFTLFETAPGDISGSFSNVTWDSFDNGAGRFAVIYNNADGDVSIEAELAPEPASITLVGFTLCALLLLALIQTFHHL